MIQAGDAAVIEDNYFAYFTEVEEYFVRKRGRNLLVSPLDWCLIELWKESGIPLHVVLRGIDRSFENAEKRMRRRPLTLSYCHPAVLEAYAEHQETMLGRGDEEDQDGGSDDRRLHGEGVADFLRRLVGLLEGRDEEPTQLARERLRALALEVERMEWMDGDRLERELGSIGCDLAHGLLEGLPVEARRELKRKVTADLKPYRKHVSREVLERLRQRQTERLVLEHFGLPSFSLLDLGLEVG